MTDIKQIIGDWIEIITTIPRRLQSRKFEERKDAGKDVMMLVGLFGFFMFMFYVMSNPMLFVAPKYTDPQGNTYEGNCDWLHEVYKKHNKEYKTVNTSMLESINFKPPSKTQDTLARKDLGEEDDCPECPDCPTPEPCTCKCPPCKQENTPKPQPCPPCTCKCPETSLDDKTLHEIKNARPKAGGAAYSGGWFDMKQYCLTKLGVDVGFSEKPSTIGEYYRGLYGRTETDGLICFKDASRGNKIRFKINNSIWRIRGRENQTLTVYKP